MKDISRRTFLKRLGIGTAVLASPTFVGCASKHNDSRGALTDIPTDKMTYRENPKTHERVSLLGYGCMRWPTKDVESSDSDDKPKKVIDQEQVNALVAKAIKHGVNYFDTSPAYCEGKSEEATGIALAPFPRDSYFIATKMSNFAPETWPREASIKMYHDSLRYLRTDHIDYMLLHCVGLTSQDASGKELNGMETLRARFFDNGILDYLMSEREADRIRNLGFSYHGDIKVFDHLLSMHDRGETHWDFVQIQLSYVDWKHAKEIEPLNTNAEYLYGELAKRHIPAVVMEPLLGGQLARVPAFAAERMTAARPDDSIASWAFRFAASLPNILTVLSGMTYMEHLEDNLRTFCPLQPCTEEERKMLSEIAQIFVENPFIPCTGCQYCMPCPYGLNIPAIFAHYNRCINEEHYTKSDTDPNYREARRAYLIGYDRSVPRLRQADHCVSCGKCAPHCPQSIAIPKKLHEIDAYVEKLRRDI